MVSEANVQAVIDRLIEIKDCYVELADRASIKNRTTAAAAYDAKVEAYETAIALMRDVL